MVFIDEIHRLAHQLAMTEGMNSTTLQESFLSLEGLVRQIDETPFMISHNAEKQGGYFKVLVNLGILPIMTVLENQSPPIHYFAICGHKLDNPTVIAGDQRAVLRDQLELAVTLDDALALLEFPYRRTDGNIRFVILPFSQFKALTDNGVAWDRRQRLHFLQGIDEDSSAVESLYAACLHAIARGASDIHIEPDPNLNAKGGVIREVFEAEEKDEAKNAGRIRYRIDGVLQTGDYLLTGDLVKRITALIKTKANLKMDEHRLPQDGRLSFDETDLRLHPQFGNYDFRVSVLPTVHGEKAELRLLKKQTLEFDLESLGIDPAVLPRLIRKINEPKGMILITGPTGSGKTTTLYAALNHINNGELNIITAEDPVEIVFPGLVQVQANKRIGLDFAAIIRTVLRQDPDVIFIGEIRDEETLGAAIRASITGHLVFSTIHVDSALGVPMRMSGMGVSGVSIASGLLCVMSQRLIRKLCEYCCQKYDAQSDLVNLLGKEYFNRPIELYRAGQTNCAYCGGTGYSGRRLLIEFWAPSALEKELLSSGEVSLVKYYPIAIEHGFEPMSHMAMRAIVSGETDIGEVIRHGVSPDDFLRDGKLIARSLNAYLDKAEKMPEEKN